MSDATVGKFSATDFPLQSGETLAELDIAYETYGDPANAPANTILLLHGYTSNPHAGGGGPRNPGWWEGLIGSGCAIDTDQYFVISPNMLGSSYGTTGPGSKDPATEHPYGPSFPDISTRDMIDAHRLLLNHFGVRKMAAIVGYSYGGYLAFQWAVTYPERMRCLVPVATGFMGRGDESSVRDLERHFEAAPGWNGGDFYDNDEGIEEALIDFRANVLLSYGVDQELRDKGLSEEKVTAGVQKQAKAWAKTFDPNSLIALRRCAVRFNAKPEVVNIEAPLLYILATTDKLFGPELGETTVEHIRSIAGSKAEYFELDSPYGHRAPSVDWEKWGHALRSFLDANAVTKVKAAE